MNLNIKNDHFKITQNEFDDKLYTIYFNSNSQALISSIAKTKIILGATTTEKYNTFTFKATKVQTFKEYQIDLERENGTKKLSINGSAVIILFALQFKATPPAKQSERLPVSK